MEELVATALKAFLEGNGILGSLVVIQAGVIVYLYREMRQLERGRVADTERIVVALERASASNVALTAAMEARNGVLLEVARTLETTSVRTHELLGDLKDAFQNLSRS